MIKRLEHRMEGVAIKARADPPSVVLRPWYNITLVFTGVTVSTTTVVHTISVLRTKLQDQLGLPTDATFLLRLRELRTWGPLGGALTATISDPTTVGGVLTELSDTGSASVRPHFGYIFPSRISMQGLSSSSNPIASYVGSGIPSTISSVSFEAHYACQFRIT